MALKVSAVALKRTVMAANGLVKALNVSNGITRAEKLCKLQNVKKQDTSQKYSPALLEHSEM